MGEEAMKWEPPEDFDPTEALIRNLVAKDRGEPVNELECGYAACFLAASTFVQAGMDIDVAIGAAERLYDRGGVHAAWSEEDGLEITVGELGEGSMTEGDRS